MIGFDLVDLQFALGSKHQNDPRFIHKIYSKEEQLNFSNSLKDPSIQWVMWSMKESAYKAIPSEIQEDFNPKKFHINTFIANKNFFEGQVQHNEQLFHCRCEIKNNRISAIALKHKKEFENVKFDVLKIDSDSVALARKVLKDSIQLFLNKTGIGNVRMSYLSSGKPVLVQLNDIKENISLSHHGHFAGFAYLPI